MAKRPNRKIKTILEGVSEQSLKEATQAFEQSQKEMIEKKPFINLPLGKRVVSYELVKVKPSDIEKRTYVLEGNARSQSFLTPNSLVDITETMTEHGQQFPAIGQRDNDKIIVIDGSRRRASCIETNSIFWIYVTDEKISNHEAIFQSNTGNAHKPLSLYENGKQWKKLIHENVYKDAKELSIKLNKSESIVYDALNSTDIPLSFLLKFPAASDLGRPAFNKIRKLIKLFGYENVENTADQFVFSKTTHNAKETNKTMLDFISSELQKTKNPSVQKQTNQRIYIGSNKSKATIKETKLGVSITLEKLSDSQKNYLDDILKTFLNNEELTV